ncbi:hypothetical protein V7149_17210 [Bacillus sp. JJ1503]|uniref:hypothetical protein n=1 Tax=unclassified Bacillus (in: firmicutes) TaxID=185979 RepID=UPI002FFDC415
MNFNESVLSEQYEILRSFLYHYSSFRYLHKKFDDLCRFGSQEFWVYTINAHYFQSINLWCMIFGTNNNETHWKKLGLEGELKPIILSKLELSEKDYNLYWNKLVEWRNKYSAHRVPGFIENTPDLKIARMVVFIYEDWVAMNIDASVSFSLELYEENFKEDLNSTISTMLTASN